MALQSAAKQSGEPQAKATTEVIYGRTVPLAGIGSGVMALTAPFSHDGFLRRVDHGRENPFPYWFTSVAQATAFLRAQGVAEPEVMRSPGAADRTRLEAWLDLRARTPVGMLGIEGLPVSRIHAADAGNGYFLWRVALSPSDLGYQVLGDNGWSFTAPPFVFPSEVSVKKTLARLGVRMEDLQVYLPATLGQELTVERPEAYGPTRFRRELPPTAVTFKAGPAFPVWPTGEPDPGGDVRLARMRDLFVPWTLEGPNEGRFLVAKRDGKATIPVFSTEGRAFRSLSHAGFTVQTMASHLVPSKEIEAILDGLSERPLARREERVAPRV